MGMGACKPPRLNASILSILDEALNHSSDGVLILSSDGEVLYVSKSISSLLGFTKDELLGTDVKELYANPNPSLSNGSEVKLKRRIGDTINCFEVTKAFERENGLFYKLIWKKSNQKQNAPDDSLDNMESVKKMLTISGEINHLITWERDSRGLLRKVCKSITGLKEDLSVWIGFFNQGRMEVVESTGYYSYSREKLDHLVTKNEFLCLKALESETKRVGTIPIDHLCKKYSLNGDDSVKKLVIPVSHENKLYGVIWAHSDSESLSNEELDMINGLAKDFALALKTIEVEKKRKEALDKMGDNLEYFEYLADRLRNPLAIMRGFVDLKEDIGTERTFKELSNQINRMNRLLDNLRIREEETFKLRENLIR